MTSFLFVYGTLRAGSGHPMAARLVAAATSVARASVRGQLLEVGRYPALVLGGETEVVGDCLRLDPEREAKTLDVLDGYEGVGDEPPLFRRVEAEVQDAEGRRRTAWIYVWARDTEGLRAVEGGDWLARGRSSPA